MPSPLMSRPAKASYAVVCAFALALGNGLAHADSDHDRARQALQAGDILPLVVILERLEREQAGKVLDVELDREKDNGVEHWVYKIKMLTTSGTRLKLQVDAKSGELISRKRKE